MATSNPLFRVRGLCKSFGSTRVLKDVNLSVAEGSSVLIQGPSGCGKTTLLRCMALLEVIDGGHIELMGELVLLPNKLPRPKRPWRLAISMVFQDLYLWDHLTVFENISLPLRLSTSLSETEIVERASMGLDEVGLAGRGLEYPPNLSGGQQQRVALARALVHRPRLLLLDEITANIDIPTAARVFRAVQRVRENGVTTVLVSHSDRIPEALKEVCLTYESGRWHTTDN